MQSIILLLDLRVARLHPAAQLRQRIPRFCHARGERFMHEAHLDIHLSIEGLIEGGNIVRNLARHARHVSIALLLQPSALAVEMRVSSAAISALASVWLRLNDSAPSLARSLSNLSKMRSFLAHKLPEACSAWVIDLGTAASIAPWLLSSSSDAIILPCPVLRQHRMHRGEKIALIHKPRHIV